MRDKIKNRGFSITEVLMAVGVLAVGMIFIAGVFPVAIYFTTVSMERTIAAVAADEAFAKIRLYGIDSFKLPNVVNCVDFNDATVAISEAEFAYPSTDITGPKRADTTGHKQYYWSALCRRVDANDPNTPTVQVTVFVSRKPGPGLTYPDPKGGSDITLPKPFKIEVSNSGLSSNELRITGPSPVDMRKTYINDGSTIEDNATGKIYRVLERYAASNQDTILLDKDWTGGGPNSAVWVVPPAVGSGKNPCMVVYQKEIRF
jgi:prepilin-type N-terminal cleavage/methylation domain-containing protein